MNCVLFFTLFFNFVRDSNFNIIYSDSNDSYYDLKLARNRQIQTLLEEQRGYEEYAAAREREHQELLAANGKHSAQCVNLFKLFYLFTNCFLSFIFFSHFIKRLELTKKSICAKRLLMHPNPMRMMMITRCLKSLHLNLNLSNLGITRMHPNPV